MQPQQQQSMKLGGPRSICWQHRGYAHVAADAAAAGVEAAERGAQAAAATGVETSERGAQAAATGMEAADEQQQQHRLMESRRSKHGVTVDITSLVLLRTRFFF